MKFQRGRLMWLSINSKAFPCQSTTQYICNSYNLLFLIIKLSKFFVHYEQFFLETCIIYGTCYLSVCCIRSHSNELQDYKHSLTSSVSTTAWPSGSVGPSYVSLMKEVTDSSFLGTGSSLWVTWMFPVWLGTVTWPTFSWCSASWLETDGTLELWSQI